MQPRPRQLLDYREYPILYVDDEPENLRIFELTFRREFAILTAPSGQAGLEVLNTQPVALVLSDHRMPGMTGVDFLARARALDPRSVRMLVTAYGDADTLQAAINDGSIYRFVPKPWEPEEMRLALRRAIEVYALERERERLLRELTMLNRVSGAINREVEQEPLLDLLLEIATQEFGYDAATLLLLDGEDGPLRWSRALPPDPELWRRLQQIELSAGSAPHFREKLSAGEIQLLSLENAFAQEVPVREWVTEVAAEESLVVPLAGGDAAIGALVVDNRRGGAAFDADDHTLLEGLAHQASIAIENARLLEALRRTRERAQQAERLGALGTLAAGLAHEIQNPLVAVHTFVSSAPTKRHEDDEGFWTDFHALASRETQRIRDLADAMRRLGRGAAEAPARACFEPAALVDDALQLLQPEAGRAGVGLVSRVAPDAPKLVASRSQLQQVLSNLLRNAIHASPRGAAVEVRVAPDGEDALRLEVCDAGPGIPAEDLERIFDPFFTTKDPERGTGLGLVICQQVVTDHGGSIEVESHPGRGTTFRVRLPAGDAGRPPRG